MQTDPVGESVCVNSEYFYIDKFIEILEKLFSHQIYFVLNYYSYFKYSSKSGGSNFVGFDINCFE